MSTEKTGKLPREKYPIGFVVLTIVVAVIFFFPIWMALLTSFKTDQEIAKSVLALPQALSLNNYKEAIVRSQFWNAIRNSAIATFPSVAVIVICSSMGGYVIARNMRNNRFFRILDRVYVMSLMLPFQIMMIPIYQMYKSLNLLNNLFGYSLVLIGISIAYPTFLYVGFVKGIPRELEESAEIDGAGPYIAYWMIVFPLLKPISMTIAVLHVMWLWNDFNMALILLQKEAVRPLTVKQFYFFGQYTSNYGVAFAAAIMGMIPILVFFVIAQKYIVDGISAGAVKG